MFDSLLLSVVVDYAPNLSNTSDTYYLQFEVHCPTAAKDRPIHISPWHPVSYFSNNCFQKKSGLLSKTVYKKCEEGLVEILGSLSKCDTIS